MLIFNEEKQILQKYYASIMQSYIANLKNLIETENSESLHNHLKKINEAGERIKWLHDEFDNDLQKCADNSRGHRRGA